MKFQIPASIFGRLSARLAVLAVALLGLGFVAMVLVPGFKLATELANTTAALQFVGEQQRFADAIRTSLDAAHDRIGTRGYIQTPLNQLRQAVAGIDRAQGEIAAAHAGGWFDASNYTASLAEPAVAERTAVLRELWSQERVALEPLLRFQSVPYQDSETTGTGLNESGRRLGRDINAAIHASHSMLFGIETQLTAISGALQSRNARSATRLRLVMLAGLLTAGLLVLAVTMQLSARRRQAHSLREARQQTADILRTVKEGLFLLDRNLHIGSTYSGALENLFQRQDIAGLAFEQLLRGVVTERTLTTALKFVSILWAERTNENLVKSINPLGEVEVHIDNGQGSTDTRYLEFDFHRVRVDGNITHVLVSVSDVTARVDLARELTSSQTKAQGQVETLLGILHVEPGQLGSFLSDSEAAMKMINAVLREPAREESAFRKKLDTLFRQAHSVKGEAAALGLSSIESRAHAFEDHLKVLRDKPELSGNDFLPLVIKLDDLLTHLQSIGDLVARLSRLHAPAAEAPHTSTAVIGAAISPPANAAAGIVSALQHLAERVAAENAKAAALQCVGFEAIPEGYRRIVKDIAVQAVRNAIVHGIEPGAARQAAGKSPIGAVRLEFREMAQSGYKFTIEDDGQGLSTDRIKEVAREKGFVTAEQAASLDTRQTYALLFQPGFSTVENVTSDAGRGVGMNLMAELVHEAGGRVAIATQIGKFTRLTLSLPPSAGRADAIEAA